MYNIKKSLKKFKTNFARMLLLKSSILNLTSLNPTIFCEDNAVDISKQIKLYLSKTSYFTLMIVAKGQLKCTMNH